MTLTTKELEKIAWAPYDLIRNPTREDWKKSYDALRQLEKENPKDGRYPNTLGYLCYYGRHTGQRNYEEARMWFEKGNELASPRGKNNSRTLYRFYYSDHFHFFYFVSRCYKP